MYFARNGLTGDIEFSGTDASKVIQSAINALTDGGRILIRKGTYLMTYKTMHGSERVCISLAGKSNIELVGEGAGTVLRLADNQNATIISLYNGANFNRIRNIKFDGNKENNPEVESGKLHPNGINIRFNSHHNMVQGCTFVNIKAHPILIITTSHRNLITENYFENNDWYDAAASGGSVGNVIAKNVVNNSIGLESYLNSHTIFTGNTLYNSPRSTAPSDAVGSIISDGIDIITDNFIINSQRTGIRSSMDSKPNIIAGNVIINPCQANQDGDAGILVYGSNKLVSNNVVSGSLQRGIYVKGDGNTILGNFVTNSTKQNILVYNVKGNKIIANTVLNGSVDIHVGGGSENIVAYNHISGSSASPIIQANGDRQIISENIIKDVNSIAISLFGAGAIFVEKNLLVNVNAGAIPNGAILVNVGANNKVIRRNILVGSGAAGIVIRGDDCIVEGNFITGFTNCGILDYSRSRNLIKGNRVFNNTYYDIRLLATVDAVCIDNDVRGSNSTKRISDEGTNTVIKRNIGYVTENSGTATITAGATYVDVTHGLATTPDINRIKVTPKDNLGGRSFWISDVGATTFRINISSTDTVDHAFGWSYE